MQYIDIFLASSITDMHLERMELGNFIRTLNDAYESRDIKFRLHMCEDMSDEITLKRSQDNYNDKIKECDYFYIMCWHSAGQYTLEEFDVALEKFRETGKAPKISTFFKKTEEPAEEVKAFMDRLDKELQHYYTKFDHIDSVKLKLLLEMVLRPELQAQVTLQDSKLMLNGKEIKDVHMDNLPIYANHERINELRKQIETLEKELINARLKISENPDDNALWQEVYKISGEKNKAEEELHNLEMELIKLASRVVEITSDGEYLTQRAKKAIELFDQGKAKEALIVLDDEERRKDAERTSEVIEEKKKDLSGYVYECEMKIHGLKLLGITRESAEKIVALYEEIEGYVKECGLDRKRLLGYINFLREQKDYQKATAKGEQLYHYFKSEENVDEVFWGRLCNNLAIIYNETHRFEESEKFYNEALDIYRRLAESDPQAYGYDLALIRSNLANLYCAMNRREEAEPLYLDAVGFLADLTKTNPLAYGPDLAGTCNNLAGLYKDTNRFEEAERFYTSALQIYPELAENDPLGYNPNLALTYNNIADLYTNMNRYGEAEQFYLKALDIRSKLAESNPQAYEPALATTYNNLANLYSDLNRYEEAKQHYTEALEIRRRLAGSYPQAYEPSLASTCSNLAALYNGDNYEEAERFYRIALDIYHKLAESDPELYKDNVAEICYNLALLYFINYTDHYEDEEQLFSEALDIYQDLAKSDPQTYEPDLAETCKMLAAIYLNISHFEEAKSYFTKAIDIYQGLAKTDPQAFEPELPGLLYNLMLLYNNSGKTGEASKCYEEALEIAEKYKDTDPRCQEIYDILTGNGSN